MVKNLLTNDDKYDRIRKSRLMFPKGTRPNPVTRWTKQSIAGAALNLKKNKKNETNHLTKTKTVV